MVNKTKFPSLIPLEFKVKKIKNTYYKQKLNRTWKDFLNDYHEIFIGLTIIIFIFGILYIKYTDKQKIKSQSYIESLNYNANPSKLPIFINDSDFKRT